ncbi:MAG TPA: Rv3654c family TadE-like protein [Microbacterium sp.]|uniref:Rv3654c family TadE-like protein n=1 Tax=Microbacterium sp. TaxID=51671 RepID=UPI002C04C2AC|nr:Rv3654c family TadE-like protein [Microbacterium sp.]HWI32028.1 Rv3654c family TadE-like protein [Microbacterium sp.]
MAGTVASVGVVACLASFAVGFAVVGGASVAGQRLAGAADAAALAAADAASGAVTGDPCARADEVAAAVGAQVAACDVDRLVATVSVEGSFAGLVLRASARAAPPPSL